MAELLVRIVDKVNADPLLDLGCTKRGDVIVVCPDGWAWGREERANPDWTILSVPDLSVEDAAIYLAAERLPLGAPPVPTRRRKLGLDLSQLAARTVVTAESLRQATVVKPPSFTVLAVSDRIF